LRSFGAPAKITYRRPAAMLLVRSSSAPPFFGQWKLEVAKHFDTKIAEHICGKIFRRRAPNTVEWYDSFGRRLIFPTIGRR